MKPRPKGVRQQQYQPTTEVQQQPRLIEVAYLFALAVLGVILAYLWGRVARPPFPIIRRETILAMVKISNSFDLSSDGRTLIATDFIPAGTILTNVPRSMMIWDLDAYRNEFVRKELFHTALLRDDTVDQSSKRAALLSSYLALLRNKAIPATNKLHFSIVNALPSYQEYAIYHPILANLTQVQLILGSHSPAYQRIIHLRVSFDNEYDSFASTSTAFAKLVTREDYLSCAIAVLSRAFDVHNDELEIDVDEQMIYQRTLGFDVGRNILSIEPVHDWMNSHINNNVVMGGYDGKTQSGRAWTTKAIPKGQELINGYGEQLDYILFSQYGYIPSDGTGSSIVWLSSYHDINLMGGLTGNLGVSPTLIELGSLIPYIQMNYGYLESIKNDNQPDADAVELKRLKLLYLQRIATDRDWWFLQLPPRSSIVSTPFSTRDVNEYEVPVFGDDIYDFLDMNALTISLPCRLITLTGEDVEDASSLLTQDLEALEGSLTTSQTSSLLLLQELEVSMAWTYRIIQCMQTLASTQLRKYKLSVKEQEDSVLALAKMGAWNSLEWFLAQVKLEEMQSLEVMVKWAAGALESLQEFDLRN